MQGGVAAGATCGCCLVFLSLLSYIWREGVWFEGSTITSEVLSLQGKVQLQSVAAVAAVAGVAGVAV